MIDPLPIGVKDDDFFDQQRTFTILPEARRKHMAIIRASRRSAGPPRGPLREYSPAAPRVQQHCRPRPRSTVHPSFAAGLCSKSSACRGVRSEFGEFQTFQVLIRTCFDLQQDFFKLVALHDQDVHSHE